MTKNYFLLCALIYYLLARENDALNFQVLKAVPEVSILVEEGCEGRDSTADNNDGAASGGGG